MLRNGRIDKGSRAMKTRIHATAGCVGFLIIGVFWASTISVELLASYETIALVKNRILDGMFILIPCLAIAGGSGISLGKGDKGALVLGKKKRMPFIALNGLLVLVPSAIFLATKANANDFDTMFYTVQAIELVAGAVNFTLLGLNIRDGIKLTGRLRKKR